MHQALSWDNISLRKSIIIGQFVRSSCDYFATLERLEPLGLEFYRSKTTKKKCTSELDCC